MAPCQHTKVALALLGVLLLPPAGRTHPSARTLRRQQNQAEALNFRPLHHGLLLRSLARSPEGGLWALDGLGGLQVRLPGEAQWQEVPRGSEDPVGNFQQLVPWGGGVVLASPFSGLAEFSGGRWHRPDLASRDSQGPAPTRIRALATHRSALWLIGDDSMHRIAPLTRERRPSPLPPGLSGRPAALASGPDSLGLVTDRGGVALLEDGETWRVLTAGEGDPRSGRMVAALGEETLWFGGAGFLGAVDLGSGRRTDLLAEDPGLGRLVVSDLLVREEELWVATLGQGVFRRREGNWQQYVPPFATLSSNVVHSLVATGPDLLLAATSEGLTEISRRARDRSRNVKAWYPRSDVPGEMDLSRTSPEPRQIFSVERAGGQFSPLAALGDILFEDPELLGERARRLGISCGTCHPRGHMNTNFFIPEISTFRGGVDLTHRFFASRSHNSKLDPVVIPSLRGVRHTAPYGRTQQAQDLRSFTRNVIVLEFEGPEPSPRTLDALVAYQREFDFLPTRWVGEDGRLSSEAPGPVKRGEALFRKEFPGLPGGSCASCHPPQSYFTDGRMHDIGTGGGYDVPTLRNANYSAPYMHDGRFRSFSQVVDFFDERFGLGLDRSQKRDLEAYLLAVGEGLDPYQ